MNILVDTNVWVDFFRRGDEKLTYLLQEQRVMTHPIIIGELASGNLIDREETLNALLALNQVPMATFHETLHLLERDRLYGRGLHWNDIQVLASALIAGLPLWTRDRRLRLPARQGCRRPTVYVSKW